MNKKISLIIPLYNAFKEFRKCIKSIEKYFDFELGEVIVIDDASSKLIKLPPNVKFIRNEKNEGYLKSCNRGVEYAAGEILIFLNSDTEICAHFCDAVIKCFDTGITAASPISSNSASCWIPQIFPLKIMNKIILKNKPVYPEIFNAEGFCFCIRKSFVDKYGLFDEIYSPGYCEEVDLCQRIKSKGGKCVLIDNLYVKHLRHKSFKSNSLRLTAEHNKILYKRWGEFFNKEDYTFRRGLKDTISNCFGPFSRFLIYKIYRLHRFLYESRFLTLLNLKFYKIKNKNRVIYTCITGKSDAFPLIQKYKDSNYVCFTDNKFLLGLKRFGEWEIRPLVFDKLDNVKNARWHKTHPHVLFPEYEESVWLDGNVEILTPKIFEDIQRKILAIPRHYCRNDVYEEIKTAMQVYPKLYAILKKQEEFLRSENMPEKYGLNETNIIYRKHHQTTKIMEEWWEMIHKYSSRDQASLSYILWKNNIKIDEISIDNARIDCLNYKIYPHG